MNDVAQTRETPVHATGVPALSIVVPTFNEAGNVALLVERIEEALGDIDWDITFVDDDSPDGTARVVRDIGARKPYVHCIRRVGRRGLSSACIEGMASGKAPVVAVMDADLQHDERILPRMLEQIENGRDLVLGSRFLDGETAKDGLSSFRQTISNIANWIANLVIGARISDPMTGFFMIRRERFEQLSAKLSEEGFKILLDIIATARHSAMPLDIGEIRFRFRARHSGESKMSPLIMLQFLALAVSKITGGVLPVSFVLFSAVGTFGILVHLAALTAFSRIPDVTFVFSQAAATLVAMASNYHFNNMITYAERRLKGAAYWWGLLSFSAVCAIPAIANVSVAITLFNRNASFYLAAIAGIIVSIVFNYVMTRIFTWRR